ncbi:hypothetical protein MPSEU_000825800 [Mayamaea pseudoterrestris]|nr:hypothetical protein MPSEU_000825800 [Mayamaea pseudoterrestris]
MSSDQKKRKFYEEDSLKFYEEDSLNNLFIADELEPADIPRRFLDIASLQTRTIDNAPNPHVSKEKQIIQLKQEMQAISTMRDNIDIFVEEMHDELIDKRLTAMHGLLDSFSPLLSLLPVGEVLKNIVSFLDEVSLYQLEEASETIKDRFPHDQWDELDDCREFGSYRNKDPTSYSCSYLRGHAFAKASIFTEKMERLACKHYDYEVVPSETAVALKECLRCKSFPNFDYYHAYDDYQSFIRLSLQEKDELKPLWCGFVPWVGDCNYERVDFCLAGVAGEMMSGWPDLQKFRCWLDNLGEEETAQEEFKDRLRFSRYARLTRVPWVKSKYSSRRSAYKKRMKRLLTPLRLTVTNYKIAEVEVCNLYIASGGFFDFLEDGWCRLHVRDASGEECGESHARNIKLNEQMWAQIRIGQDGQFDLSIRTGRTPNTPYYYGSDSEDLV